jgi:hypothetical protein
MKLTTMQALQTLVNAEIDDLDPWVPGVSGQTEIERDIAKEEAREEIRDDIEIYDAGRVEIGSGFLTDLHAWRFRIGAQDYFLILDSEDRLVHKVEGSE